LAPWAVPIGGLRRLPPEHGAAGGAGIEQEPPTRP
jgi:hypothetical protein